MPDTALSNQLPPRTPTSIREPRTYSTFGGRGSTTNDSDLNENISKTNGHHRNSKSLFRKSSTISRTDDTSIPVDENPSTSLKKSRSLMNVLRSKLNSPAVLRRFRSKSRESTKQTVTDINGHTTTNDQEQDIKQSNNEQIPTRKSRKRDPSPMRRLANRISQFTRHQRTTSSERQKKSPSKSITNDSNEEPTKSSSPLHNKDEVDHINACYNEIRAKYFNNNNNNTNKPNVSIDDTQNRSLSTISMNGSLLSNDFFNNSQRISSPIPLSDDPLLQARKQSNIKLNCMLSGYTLTTSFANHEKLVGQNDLFKFNHYYDVGKRKYDWNFTNTNNRIFSSMKTRPISKSIDTFRRTNTNDNEVPVRLEKINIVDNDPLVQTENHEDVPRILSNNNELFIYEDNDLIESKQNSSQYSTNILKTPIVPISSILIDENKMNSNEQTVEEHDEEFERNFLRAVDRALGVVNKDEDSLIQSNDTIPIETDESHLNLIQMTERALSSLNSSPLFTNDDEKNAVENEEQIKNDTELANTEVFAHINESLNNEELSKVDIEKPINDESLNNKELSKVDIEKPINDDDLNNEELSKVDIEKPINDESLNNEKLSKADIEKPINDDDLIDEDISSTIDNLIEKVEELLFEDSKNGQTFLVKLDDEEKTIKSKADAFNKLLQSDDNRLTEDVRTDINAVVGEVNLLLRGKLKQFRGLCEANVTKSNSGEPIPLDSDLEGFWDITYPLIDKVKEKFAKLDARKAKQWAPIEEYDPDDVNNRPRVIDDRLKQLQPQQNKSSKIPVTKSANDDLKKLIRERRKAAANTSNQNHDIEIFVAPK